MEKDRNDYSPPERTADDAVHAAGRVALNLIPAAGGSAAELLAFIVSPPLEKRLRQWRVSVGEALSQLRQEKGIHPEDLRDSEVFIDCVIRATTAAMRTSREEKRDALRNGILNAALADDPGDPETYFFMTYIDELSVWHLKVLDLFSDPADWARRHDHEFGPWVSVPPAEVMMRAFEELRGKSEFCRQIWRDLYVRGMVAPETALIAGAAGSSGLKGPEVLSLGRHFLEFIRNPLEQSSDVPRQ